MAQTNVQALSGDVVISSNLEVGTANLFVDTTTSNVGINTNTPGYTLDVAGDIHLTNNIYQGGEAFEAGLWSSGVSSKISFTGGKVGIGLTNPVATLDIAGPMRLGDGLSNAVDLSTGTVATAFGGTLSLKQELNNSNLVANKAATGSSGEKLGASAAISSDGKYAIVAANQYYLTQSNYAVGYCIIYVKSGSSWVQQAYIPSPRTGTLAQFGQSVAISADGTYAIIGSLGHSSTSLTPKVYFYTRDTSTDLWSKISEFSGTMGDALGKSVGISGDGVYAVAGDDDRSGGGRVSFYSRSGTTWSIVSHVTSPIGTGSNERFGQCVAMSKDGLYVIVGAQGSNSFQGAVHVYIRSGSSWSLQQRLVHPSPANADYFGGGAPNGVAISEDGLYALVGAPGDVVNGGNNSGSVHVYTRNGTSWSSGTNLANPSPAASDYYSAVGISGDGTYAIIAAHSDDHHGGGYGAGSLYGWSRSGTSWSLTQNGFHGPNSVNGDDFGRALAISNDGGTILIGAQGFDRIISGTTYDSSGAAYIYERSVTSFDPQLVASLPIRANGTLLSFTGQHICFPEGRMWEGLVVSANQNKYMSLNGPVTMGLGAIKSSESLPVVSLSNVANDRSVFGVVDRFEEGGTERTQTIGIGEVSSAKEVGDNRVIVNSIGEGALWVANTNGNLVSGDYLTTSSLPGYAQKQDSDSLKNSTVAKITMACDFSPEDIPVQIIKKKDNGDNDLDPHGRFQWVDTEKTQKAYKVRYLTSDGKGTDQSNAVHILAYVGCTYHCG